MRLRIILITLALLAFFVTITSGYFYYSALRESALRESRFQAMSNLEIIRNRLSSFLTEKVKAAKALASLPELQQAIAAGNKGALPATAAILAHFRDAIDAEGCYLIDRAGRVVAAACRTEDELRTKEDFSGTPYFRRAIEEEPAIYMAVEVKSGERWIYFGYPLYEKEKSDPSGVIVLKASIEAIERDCRQIREGVILLTDPRAMVFISTRPAWLYHVLWKHSFEKVLDDADGAASEVMPARWAGIEIRGQNMAFDDQGNEYLIYQAEVDGFPGWKLVSMSNFSDISQRLASLLFNRTAYLMLALTLFVGASVLFLYWKANDDIVRRRKAEEALRGSERQLRFLSSQLLKTQEDERKKIARELHDSIGSSLTAIKYGLESTASEAPGSSDTLQNLIAVSQHTIEEVRRIMTDLRPSILDDIGIIAALEWFCKQFRTIYSHIHVEEELSVREEDIPEHLKIIIFRIVQEAFHNIAKYSQAEFVELALAVKDSSLSLTIVDNGVGFDIPAVRMRGDRKGGVGLTSMQERAELSGGLSRLNQGSGKRRPSGCGGLSPHSITLRSHDDAGP